ncbi:ketopantoate reductase family protein [Gracilibacillus thailandensis]|uniref:2-dehydropantoate 2-reductase n=1 Tax=Gracilibacillus thailandensis TaxID=563735 RepID=A0A6N7QVW5_9BACI|nr:ketopantoate reductase family protein [Gracilibacillus thailandensis]MRI65674.1 2-dehydropantoate 2-reductase [Gracilibacillus thailandensis]
MNISIVGAGALGSYFGVRWSKAGANVQFIVREKRAAQLQDNGLKINSMNGDDQIENPVIVTDPTQAAPADIIVVSVKGYHLESVIDTLEKLVDAHTYILPILNGVKHYDVLTNHFGKKKVLGGLANIIATLDDNGHVKHTSKIDEIRFGPLDEGQIEICEQLAEISAAANMTSVYSDKILTDIWYKYMFITAFSGITTVSNMEIGELLVHEETKDIIQQLLHEMRQIAFCEKVDLTVQHLEKAWKTLYSLPASATSSMHQDYRKGLHVELEHLQGAAIELASKHQLDIPHLKTIYGILKAKISL